LSSPEKYLLAQAARTVKAATWKHQCCISRQLGCSLPAIQQLLLLLLLLLLLSNLARVSYQA